MNREYYFSTIKDFISTNPTSILGELMVHDEFKTTDQQKNAWLKEISILQNQLTDYPEGEISFEYTIPRIGHRIDTICIIDGIIFLLEFKVGSSKYTKNADDQVTDYALDLKYFHEASKDRYLIPIVVATEGAVQPVSIQLMHDKISMPLHCSQESIATAVTATLSILHDAPLSLSTWQNARYAPTPTIIEAAQAMYRNHSVYDLSRNDAGAQNLTATTMAINRIIDHCKRFHEKGICFITGVPGAGKTLAGLNIANARHRFETDEHAVFLSGNGPLVDVLQAALSKDRAERNHIPLKTAEREAKTFIQIIHKFRDDAMITASAPKEKVAIFDEAQRAWDAPSLSNFMKRKKNVTDFNQSEPEFLISIMDRHKDWAVIVCLVGGGQEIYTGEAGIQDWFLALREHFPNWKVYISDKMTDSEYVGTASIGNSLQNSDCTIVPELHLGVSLRSFRSDKLSAFIKALLDNHPQQAADLCQELQSSYPIVLTRNFDTAKLWVKSYARGTERYGLLASSEGKRLRGAGIWVPTQIDHVNWFLKGKDHVDSSYYLEVAASEFKVQGLEVDYAIVAWDADFRYINDDFDYFRFRGTRWNHTNIEQRQQYQKNAYRVLLTRARQGLVIYIPEGSQEDQSRIPALYDGTYRYLLSCGIPEI